MKPNLNYPELATRALDRVMAEELDSIWSAADLIAQSYRAGGILQVFGTGHSRIVALELAGRAGGLAPVGMLAVKDLVMFGGVEPNDILDPTYERESGIAQRVYNLAAPQANDVFLIVSNSGINSAVVEMAELVHGKGHQLIAVTSRAHSGEVGSRDASERHLADYANVVIDNGAPAGDAGVEITPGVRIGAVSSLTGVFIAQLITEAVCDRLLENGDELPIFLSANLPAGDAHNESLWAAYSSRIRPIEP